MSESTDQSHTASLLRRRVLYQSDETSFGEGIVTTHDAFTETVIVLDLDDGTFWRGSESLVEVIV